MSPEVRVRARVRVGITIGNNVRRKKNQQTVNTAHYASSALPRRNSDLHPVLVQSSRSAVCILMIQEGWNQNHFRGPSKPDFLKAFFLVRERVSE